MSSASNMALTFGLARQLGQSEFGSVMFAYLTVTVARGLNSSLFIEPMLVSGQTTRRDSVASAHTTLCIFGTIVALTIGILGSVLSTVPVFWAAFGLATVPVLSQDLGRAIALKAERPGVAALGESAWLLSVGAGLLLTASASGLVFSWLAGAIAAVAITWREVGAPGLRNTSLWRAEFLPRGQTFALEFAAQRGTSQIAIWAVRFLVTLAEFGALRGAQMLFGFSNAATVGGTPLAMIWGSRKHDRQTHLKVAAAFAAALSLLSLAPLTVIVVPALGSALLGATYAGARPLLYPLIIQRVGTSLISGALVALRLQGSDQASRRSRMASSTLTLTLALGGAVGFGTTGAVWGFAAAGLLGALVWWGAVLWQA